MSTSIEKSYTFKAGIHVENKFQINLYNLHLYMSLCTEDPREQVIAIERINFLIENCLESCVFVHEKDKSLLDKYLECNIRLCTLPEEPYDQIVMTAIMLKVNSICENRIKMDSIKINSQISDYLSILGDMESIPEIFCTDNWWNQPNICISDYCFNKTKKNKIVHIASKTQIEWEDCYLWEVKEDNQCSAEILFTNNGDQKS